MEPPSDTRGREAPPGMTRPLATGLAVAAGLLRLVPHPANLTPVGALGLFAGARLRSWHAFALPVLVMAATDAVLYATHGYPPSAFVYASFLVNVLIGRALTATESPWRIGAASFLCSLQFFLVTNFGVWLTSPGPLYPHTPEGLLACYAA